MGAVLYALLGGGNTAGFAWWAVAAFLACAVPIFIAGAQATSCVALVALVHVVYFPFAVVINLLSSTPGVSEEPIWVRTPEAMQLCVFGMLGLGAGALLINLAWPTRKGAPVFNASIAHLSPVRLLILNALVILYALILYSNNAYFHMLAGGDSEWSLTGADSTAWMGYFEYISYAALLLQLLRWSATRSIKDALYSILLTAIPFFTMLPSGSRDLALRGVVPAVGIVVLSRTRLRIRTVVLVCSICAMVLWFVLLGMNIYRGQIYYKGVAVHRLDDRLKLIGTSIVRASPGVDKDRTDEQLQALGNRLADYVVPAMATQYYPDVVPYRHFEGMETWLPYLLPHQLRPEAYQADPQDGARLSASIGFRGGTLDIYNPTSEGSSPSMVIGDWYSRFGAWGVFFGMALCGAALRLLDRFLASGALWGWICLGLLIVPVMKLSHLSLFNWVMFFSRAMVVTLILAAGIQYFLLLRWKNPKLTICALARK
jgi:hypothetical protein